MTDFLPKDYEVPDKGGSYMKFKKGENRFRILNSPIIGYEGWKRDKEGGKHPIRKRMSEAFMPTEIDDPEEIRHFWALPVYNYQGEAIQILEVTQKSIQKSLRSYAKDVDWGDPREYDIVVNRTGDGMETRYEVMPKPKKAADAGVLKAYSDMGTNLESLFDGSDPFAGAESADEIADAADEALNGNNNKVPF